MVIFLGTYVISYRVDYWARVYVDGKLISQNDNYRRETQASIPANVSIVAFEIGNVNGDWGFRTSYNIGFATTTEELNQYWRCTDDWSLINADWNLEGEYKY